MPQQRKRASSVILIAGPTGSGKSRLALSLARARDGVVINADSMQVYHELRILTARPSPEDEALIPHRLYGHVRLREAYSVGDWLRDVSQVISDVQSEGRRPIIVGGTGLYFMALVEGLSPVPQIPKDIRDHWRHEGDVRLVSELFEILLQRDQQMARRLRPSDRQRIVRALEVMDATGLSLAQWQKIPTTPLLKPGSYAGLVVECERFEIYRACDRRFDEMMSAGAVEEVRFIRDMQLEFSMPGMRALGLRPLLAYLDGKLDLDGAVRQAKLDTRHYVKRQLTWLRRNMIAWDKVSAQDVENIP